MDKNQVPGIPVGLISGHIEGYSYFLNPKGHHGVSVLLGEALEVFEKCGHGLTIGEIERATPWSQANPERYNQIITALGQIEIIDLGQEFTAELQEKRQKSKVKRMLVWLQITDSCNLECGYCYIFKKLTHMNLGLAKSLITKVVTDCEKAGFDEVVFKFAGGEPTLRWNDIRSIINWAEANYQDSKPAVKFHVITNGTLVPPSLLEYVKSKRTGISISLDGVEEWHDKQRHYANGSGSFIDVDKDINRFLSMDIHPDILTTVTKENVRGLTDLVKYCVHRDLGFRFSFYRDVPITPTDLKNDNTQLTQELLRCYDWMAHNMPSRSLYRFHKFGDMNLKIPKIRACGIGTNGMTITSNGQVCICQYEMADTLGSVFDVNTVETIANQNHYRLSENKTDKYPGCRDCEWRFVCGGGCPFLTKRHYGTFQHPSPYCSVYKAVLPVLTELHALQLISKSKQKGGV